MAGTQNEGTDPQVEAARWYTATRHIPWVIGKLNTGEKIPGGPYTGGQLMTTVCLFLALWLTRPAWSTTNSISNLAILFGVPIGAAWLVGRKPATIRNPLTTASAVPAAWGAGQGRYRDKVLKTAQIGKVHTEVPVALIDLPDEVAVSAEDVVEDAAGVPVEEPRVESTAVEPVSAVHGEPEVVRADVESTPRSAVQALLAGAARRS